jgi:predicted dehydrogenase
LQRAASSYDIPHAYASLEAALSHHPDILGAVVAVPHRAHYQAAREVLESGLHLLLEKPMTLFAQEARSLVDLAAEKDLHLLVGYTFPYEVPAQEAKKRIEDGLLGELHYITCSMSSMTIEFLRGKPQAYTSVMNYPVTGPTEATYSDPKLAGGGQGHLQITHSAGLMFYLAPELRAKTVSAYMTQLDAKVDVADAIAARMTNGAVATIGSTGNIGTGDGGILEVHLHGSKGRLLVDAIDGHLHMRLHDGTEERIEATHPDYPASRPTQHFIDLILDGAPNFLPGATVGLHTVELLDAAYRSAAQEGVPVAVASLY